MALPGKCQNWHLTRFAMKLFICLFLLGQCLRLLHLYQFTGDACRSGSRDINWMQVQCHKLCIVWCQLSPVIIFVVVCFFICVGLMPWHHSPPQTSTGDGIRVMTRMNLIKLKFSFGKAEKIIYSILLPWHNDMKEYINKPSWTKGFATKSILRPNFSNKTVK